MKKLLLLLILNSSFIIHNSFSQSPNWLWAKSLGGTSGGAFGMSIAIDPANGDVYTTGNFFGTVDFDPSAGAFNLTSASGYRDIFISKLDASGNFVWAKAMGGTDWDEGLSIAIDPTGSGAVYTTGYFAGTADFDPDSSGSFNLTSAGSNDIFISKLDGLGNFVWAIALGGTGNDNGNSLTIDPGSGDIYSTGFFFGTVDFDPDSLGIFNLNSGVYYDIFISKLNNTGNFVWTKQLDGVGGPNSGNSIAFDPAGGGALYTTGGFSGITDFDPGAGVFSLTPAHWEIFISKLDTSGNFVWAKAMGGTNADLVTSISIDTGGSGAVYTTGHIYYIADFDPGPGVFNLTPVGDWDFFISKLDSLGNFVWAKLFGGFNTDYGNSIVVDPSGSGDVYTTGQFHGTVDFDPGAGTFPLTSAGGSEIFISKLNGSGNFVWTKALGGTDDDYGKSIAVGASGNMHVMGGFGSPTITFGSTTITNAGGDDIFIAKLDTTVVTGIDGGSPDGSGSLTMTSIFPNPFSGSTVISFTLSKAEKVSIKMFDVNGRLVSIPTYVGTDKIFEAGEHKLVWNASDVDAGVYFLRMETARYSKNQKLVITR